MAITNENLYDEREKEEEDRVDRVLDGDDGSGRSSEDGDGFEDTDYNDDR